MNESEANQSISKKCPQCGKPLPTGALDGLCPACLLAQGVADTGLEAAPFQPPSVEELARLFPQLEILAFVGKGGMGAVYKARQPTLDRFVALKILPPQVASGPGFGERFNREARALARLSHPNIVAVHEFGQVNGLPFFIMEFVDGLNLRQLERAGKLSPREALQIVPQICEALQFAHDEGIVHRDIKPENILVDKKGRIKIADFGIAKIMGTEPDVDLTQTKDAIGTPHYMAPEQVEKPQTVDHRADIFSLGVVFYEMLTGELPLGKFAPPSSRKVEVDVRLDDVVLRALEKDPERRYQHVSQVKTAVDTIASTAASPPPTANARVLAQEILARDYTLDIGSCLRRGWALVKSNFWPLIGVSALIGLLIAIAHSAGTAITAEHGKVNGGGGILGLLVDGPLMGGLYLYYLKKIRGEVVSIETAFSGFSKRFLHLFLGSLVSFVLIGLGFLCLILPGIYLLIAWWFTLPLIMDKRLDFWSAMELSRKVITQHWWKFFGFGIVLLLLKIAGLMVFCLGFFIACPIAMASLMYAYEDIFNATGRTATPQMAGAGLFGTSVLPEAPPKLAGSGGGMWKPVLISLVAVVALVVGLLTVISLSRGARRHQQRSRVVRQIAVTPVPQEVSVEAIQTVEMITNFAFGPVVERVLNDMDEGRGDEAIYLRTGQLLSAPPERVHQREAFTAAFKVWLQTNRMDLLAAHGESAGIVEWRLESMGLRLVTFPGSQWTDATPSDCTNAFISGTVLQGDELVPPGSDLPLTYAFETREGDRGLLQIPGFTENPRTVKIRYKLVQQSSALESDQDTAGPVGGKKVSRQSLSERLEAASMMNDFNEKDKSLAALAIDAAKAGELEIVKMALRQMTDFMKQNQTALESARALAKRGQRKQALEIAKGIIDFTIRDKALSELAQ